MSTTDERTTKGSPSNSVTCRGAFETDTLHRLLTECARYWLIEHFLRTGSLPEKETRFIYDDHLDWGNSPGPDDEELRPLRYRRVKISLEIEDSARE